MEQVIVSAVMECPKNTAPDDAPEAELTLVGDTEFDPGAIGALTLEQRAVYDLYSQGYALSEIARYRGTDKSNIQEVIASVPRVFEADKATATMAMLKEGALSPLDGEAEAAQEAVQRLAAVLKEVLGAFVIAGTYEEAGKMLGYTVEETRLDIEIAAVDMRADYNMAQIARIAYVARLDDYFRHRQRLLEDFTVKEPIVESEPEPVEEKAEEPEPVAEPEIAEPEPEVFELNPEAKANIQTYITWMFTKEEKIEETIGAFDDEKLATLADAIRAAAKKYISSVKPLKKRKAVTPAGEYVNRWLDGQTIPTIAGAMGKTDGTVRLSLEPFAEKIGDSTTFEELLAQAEKIKDKRAKD